MFFSVNLVTDFSSVDFAIVVSYVDFAIDIFMII